MSETAILVEGVGKCYRLGRRDRYVTLRGVLADSFASPFTGLARRWRGELGPVPGERELLWALRDVGLTVARGDVLGLVGRNGAGKSTLLKILSRITEPTTGRVELHGRVGSLLEVGTGFHPELTGRENIYLNGAILGMRRAEIARKFDEIVAFAETERFIDTPVKHYSSGMYMRLAFAVAAHLEAEILLVDEVLAVGDAAFQRKCLGKMGDVAYAGRTVIFVSHNLEAIQRLCTRAVLLEDGRLADQGTGREIVARYLSGISTRARAGQWIDLTGLTRLGRGSARFTAIRYASDRSALEYQPCTGAPLEFALLVDAEEERNVGSLAVTIYNQHGTKLVNADSHAIERTLRLRAGRNEVRIRLQALHLNPGVYRLGLWLADPMDPRAGPIDFIETAFELEVFGLESDRIGLTAEAVVACEFTVSDPVPAPSEGA
jgi:ABC-type polysaccharide/polyol phosphate transport system ATPase subunit